MKKIRFAPGKGNQKLLVMYTDGAEVWDTKDVRPCLHLSQYNWNNIGINCLIINFGPYKVSFHGAELNRHSEKVFALFTGVKSQFSNDDFFY